jgi:hypothetical protein
MSYQNFSGTLQSKGGQDVHPKDVNELKQIVGTATTPLRIVGSGLSFNDMSHGTNVTRIHLKTYMNKLVCFDADDNSATAQAGMTLFDFCAELASKHGRALANIPNFGQMTLGGLIASGVHGTSGRLKRDTFTNSLASIEMVNGNAQYVQLDAREDGCCCAGLFGVIFSVTFHTVPLFDVHHIARHINPSCEALSIYELALKDLATYDWVMYKYLIGAAKDTFMREVFTSHQRGCIGDYAIQDVHNNVSQRIDDIKTLCKYFFPANKAATNVPWRNAVFVKLCERNHKDVYFKAMMGPQAISPHAELEWCIPLAHLQQALTSIAAFITNANFNNPNSFFNQPIECHVRFSPGDAMLGHAAYGLSTEWFAWVNLNVRQKIQEAAQEFAPIEEIFIQLNGKPHWTKCWSNSTQMQQHVFDSQQQFIQQLSHLCTKHDPRQLFIENAASSTNVLAFLTNVISEVFDEI